jgi:hypothetical protein
MKILILSCFVLSCGPDFGQAYGDCKSCTALSADGGQIPIVVNVIVNVNQTQTQTQTETNTENTTAIQILHDSGVSQVPDSGLPSKDAGVVTLKPDSGVVCKQVCTCVETHYICKGTEKDTTKSADCTCGVKTTYSKCVKEVTQCR